jgi:hypothetical protein
MQPLTAAIISAPINGFHQQRSTGLISNGVFRLILAKKTIKS